MMQATSEIAVPYNLSRPGRAVSRNSETTSNLTERVRAFLLTSRQVCGWL